MCTCRIMDVHDFGRFGANRGSVVGGRLFADVPAVDFTSPL